MSNIKVLVGSSTTVYGKTFKWENFRGSGIEFAFAENFMVACL